MELGWQEMQKAQGLKAGTERERAYIASLARFYKPGSEEYQARIDAYSKEMGSLYAKYPDDVDAGAFYALSLLAAVKPDDTSLGQEHKAMEFSLRCSPNIVTIPALCTTSFTLVITRP
jgi:hypothetical protein